MEAPKSSSAESSKGLVNMLFGNHGIQRSQA